MKVILFLIIVLFSECLGVSLDWIGRRFFKQPNFLYEVDVHTVPDKEEDVDRYVGRAILINATTLITTELTFNNISQKLLSTSIYKTRPIKLSITYPNSKVSPATAIALAQRSIDNGQVYRIILQSPVETLSRPSFLKQQPENIKIGLINSPIEKWYLTIFGFKMQIKLFTDSEQLEFTTDLKSCKDKRIFSVVKTKNVVIGILNPKKEDTFLKVWEPMTWFLVHDFNTENLKSSKKEDENEDENENYQSQTNRKQVDKVL